MKFRLGVTAAALCLASLTSAAAAAPTGGKTVLTHETLWMMKRVGRPLVSPDGRWVVYSVLEPSYEPDKAVSDLWIVATDGKTAPRRLTDTKAPESDVVWSPDSTRLAFVTRRDGDAADQIYVLNLAEGGEAQRLTNLSSGAFDPQWRPDGEALLFETLVWPGALDDAANAKITAAQKAKPYNLRVYEHFPVRYWNRWLDGRRPTVLVQTLAPGATAKDILSPTALAHEQGFFGLEGDTHATLAPIWSPDGAKIIFTATTEAWNAAFAPVNFRLYSLPAGGGAASMVTPVGGIYQQAKFSPDGRWLYFKYEPQDQEIYHLARLSRLAWPGCGPATTLTPDFDHETAAYALSADSRLAYLLVPDQGREDLYELSASGGGPKLIIAPKQGGYTALDIAEKAANPVLVAAYGSSISPAEVVRLDPAAGTHINLTTVDTQEAATIDWTAPLHFTFVSAKGRSIHSMVFLPPHFDPSRKYPLFVFIHGGAASANSDQIGLRWDPHLLAAPGYVILMSDYTGSTTFGEKFAQAIKGDPLKTPGEEINQAVDVALAKYPFIDGSRICAGGASYGGHLTYWLEATTTRFKCLISHAGEVDLTSQWGTSDFNYGRELENNGPPWEGNPVWRDQSPITYGDKWRTPILLSVGERDFRVPINNTLEAWSVLQRQKVPSRLLVWPDAWHWITKPADSRQFYEEVETWLATYLKPEAATPAP